MGKYTIAQYRVLNPCALPSGAIIVQKAGVGEFRCGDVLDEKTFRRAGGRSLIMGGYVQKFHVEATEETEL